MVSLQQLQRSGFGPNNPSTAFSELKDFSVEDIDVNILTSVLSRMLLDSEIDNILFISPSGFHVKIRATAIGGTCTSRQDSGTR